MLSYLSNTSVSVTSLTMPILRSRSDRLFDSPIQSRSLRFFPLSTSHAHPPLFVSTPFSLFSQRRPFPLCTVWWDLLMRKCARKDLQWFRIQHKKSRGSKKDTSIRSTQRGAAQRQALTSAVHILRALVHRASSSIPSKTLRTNLSFSHEFVIMTQFCMSRSVSVWASSSSEIIK